MRCAEVDFQFHILFAIYLGDFFLFFMIISSKINSFLAVLEIGLVCDNSDKQREKACFAVFAPYAFMGVLILLGCCVLMISL